MNEEHIDDFYTVVSEFKAADQSQDLEVVSGSPAPKEYAENIDIEAFLKDWSELQDTHDFYPSSR